jgi:hypothetical protein
VQAAPRPPGAPIFPERRYNGLRMLASMCVVSAWLTLIVSVLMGLSFLAMPTPGATAGLPIPARPDLDPGGLGGAGIGAGGIGALLPALAGGLRWIGAVTTIGGGVISFFLLAALGQAIYVLLDMEENTRITAHAMAHIARRMGG